jgi:hypothetical protein
VIARVPLPLILVTATLLRADDLKHETAAAFEHYVKLTEEVMQARSTQGSFLWLDQHPKEKDLVWLGQSFLMPQETLDHGKKIDVPDGSIQHWLGAIYLDTATVERARDVLLDYANYKNFLKQQVIESRLEKRDGDHFDAFLRLQKKRFTRVVLNMELSTNYTAPDGQRASIVSRSTRIGEVPHSGKNSSEDKELLPGEQNGYLWRMNLYWRLQQANVGVYAELEMISLSRSSGRLHSERFLNGFQNFLQELTEAFIDGLHHAFPPPR